MKIKTKLHLIIITVFILFAGIVAISLLWQKQADRQFKRQALVMELNMAIFERARLREEYFLYREDRSKEQFLLIHKQIGGLVKRMSGTFTGLEEKVFLNNMTGFHMKIGAYFNQLVRLDQSATVHTATTQALRERIISQMLVNAHSLYREGLRLLNAANEKTVYQNNLAHLYGNIVFGLLALFIVTFAVIIIRSVTYPLTRLHKGTEIIAEGNLDYKTNIRTPDEIGQLSTAFDVMTENLQKITVSRDELSKEIEERKRMEEKLRESEKQNAFQAELLRNAPVIAAFHDSQLNMVWANKAYEEATGLSVQEMAGKKCYSVWGLTKACRNCPVVKAIESGEPGEAELTPQNQDHWPESQGYWLSRAAPVRDADGRVLGAIETAIDITQRKQAEDELRQKTHELGERVKELNCLYAFSNLIEKPDICLPEIFQGLVDIIPSGWQYPEMTCARLVLEDQIFKTANFMETIWKQSSPILVDGRHIGDLEVYYLEGKPEFEEGPFLKDERNLIDALAGRLGKTIKRIWAEEALRKAHDELELRVEERTAELMIANEQLNQEMEEHKQVEEEKVRQHRRLEALWKITRNIDADYKTLYDMVLVEIIEMTQSRYGFYGFINEDESVMTIHSWSKEAMESCKISDKPIEFPIVKAGLWGEAVRKRKISIVNDYKGDHPGKKGIPEGHVSLTRVLTVPVLSHGRIIALATISDKPTDYTEEDAEQINAFMTHLQVILERRQAEEALRESENRLRSLSSQLLIVQENERKRIAMELHDGIGQLLTAIKFKVENVLQEKGKARANEKSLEAIIPMVKESVEEIRRIQMDLRPSVLDDLGILATIGWFTREFQKVYSHISIEKEIHLLEDQVPDPLKIVLFRVIQEAMNNIAKHSKADLVHLSLQKTDGTIELAIQDNGQGFNLMEVLSVEGSRRGLGLTSMRERTELSGGSFVVESTRGRGTLIRALWPTG
jgi:PAS domain S-box-containing protein